MSQNNGHGASDEGFVGDEPVVLRFSPGEFTKLSQEHTITMRPGMLAEELATVRADHGDSEDQWGLMNHMLAALIVEWTFGREPTPDNVRRLHPNIYLKLVEEASAYLPLEVPTSSEPTTAVM